MLESTPLPGLRREERASSGQLIRKRGMVSICLLLFSASPFGKGGLRGISNPQIPPYPPEAAKKSHKSPPPSPSPNKGEVISFLFQFVHPLPWRERVG